MNERNEVKYWIRFETAAGELIESLPPQSTLSDVKSLADGFSLDTEQVATDLLDYSIQVGTELLLDERKFAVKSVSMSVRDGKTYAEIFVFVVVQEI